MQKSSGPAYVHVWKEISVSRGLFKLTIYLGNFEWLTDLQYTLQKCPCTCTGWVKSPCAPVREGHCTVKVGKSYTRNTLGGIFDLCHMSKEVTSNTYCNFKYCTFAVTFTHTNNLHLTGAWGLLCSPSILVNLTLRLHLRHIMFLCINNIWL